MYKDTWIDSLQALYAALCLGHSALRLDNGYPFDVLGRRLLIIGTQAGLAFCEITARMIIHAATSPRGYYLRCSDSGR